MRAAIRTALLSGLPVAVLLCGTGLGQTPLHSFHGSAANDGLGDAIGAAGDVNADGFDDLIVGFWHGDVNGPLSGSALVFSGKDGSLLHTFHGDAPQDLLGTSVDGAGDVDADGYADLVVGALGDDDNAELCGSARVFSGQDGSILYTFFGDGWNDLLGSSVSGAGDVDNDGHDDIVAGAPGQNGSPELPFHGYARVYSGKDGSILRQMSGALVPSWENFGSRVNAAGDVNLDGHDDLIVASYYWDPNPFIGFQFSYGQVISGKDGSSLHIFQGDQAGGFLGRSLDGAGDVDGDGFPDLVLGAPYMAVNGAGSGGVRVFSGKDGSVLYTVLGESFNDLFGTSVAGIGDLNGDGLAEVLAGAPGEDELGPDSGSARVLSGPGGAVQFTLHGDASTNGSWGPQFGFSVSPAGDVDADGHPDLVTGAPRDNAEANDSGAVHVFSGDCLPPAVHCVAAPNSAGPGAHIGSSGSQSVSANTFTLSVQGAPPNVLGLFIYARYEAQVPFGDGFLCLQGGTTGVFRLLPALSTGSLGAAARLLDFTQPPVSSGPGAITPGSTWDFQFWYRDPAAGGSSFNLSDAMAASFCM